MEKTFYFWDKNTLYLNLQIQTKAKKNAVIGKHSQRLKVAISAVPEDGKANLHLVGFLALYFGVKQRQVKITNGHKSRYKSVMIMEPKDNLEQFMSI